MRRLLGICALAAAILVVFGVARRVPCLALAASLGQSSPAKAIIIAKGVAARALALDSHAGPDLTTAAAPNRVFALGSSLAPQTTSAMPATALTAIAGVGRAGSLGDGGAATEAQLDLASDSLSERSGITVTSDGTIFIADSQNSTIRSVAGQASSEPGIIRSVAGRWAARQNVALADPMGITADRAGNLYIADHGAGAVDVLVAATGRLETLAQVVSPASIAATLDGTKVFVASPETGGVFAIATSTHAITGVAGFPATAAAASSTAPGPSACPSIENGTIVAPRSQAICPAGLAVDGRGNLFVADANAGRILRVDAIASKITVAASGLSTPGDIAFDSKGDLFVSEQGLTRLIELPQLGDPASAISLTTSSVFAAPCPQVNNPFTFCNTPSGGASQQAAFTLTSTSAVTGVTVGFIPATTPGNFTVESNGCTASLGAGQTCQINVAFTPQTTGALTSALSVTDSNPADAATVSLAGTGDNYSLPLASGQQLELTIVQGGTAVFNGQVAPDSVFGQDGESVQLVCPISSTMPSNTSCVIAPCQATITPGMATPFKITFVTSSATSVAPVPPQSTGCTSYGPPPTSLVAPEPRSREPLDGGQFPPPLLLATFAAIALFLGRLSATTGESTGRKGLPFTLAIAGFAVAILMGCHHGNSNIIGPATTAGTTTMTVTGKALDANGNSLNTSRAMPQITLDVVAQPTGGGGFP